MFRKKIFLVLISIVMGISGVQAQTKTNLEVFFSLIDSSVSVIDAELPEETFLSLQVNLPGHYSIFHNAISSKVSELNSASFTVSDTIVIKYDIYGVSVEYSEPERESIFGDFFSERKCTLEGSYASNKSSKTINKFSLSYADTLVYESIEKVENKGLPFTAGNRPEAPLFDSLLEPIVLIGSGVVAIVLFFTVRSN